MRIIQQKTEPPTPKCFPSELATAFLCIFGTLSLSLSPLPATHKNRQIFRSINTFRKHKSS